MKIVLLDGGLANQMTQYIFARCLEEELKDTDEIVFLDDLWFYAPRSHSVQSMDEIEHLKYQLNKFPNLKKVRLMSEYFDTDVWNEIIEIAKQKSALDGGSWLPQILKDNGLDFFMIAEAPLYQFDGKVARMPYYYYMPEMLKSQGNTYYFGWFTHGGWFMSHEEMFRRELQFVPLWKPYDLDMLSSIENSLSISVHIRRGTYAVRGQTTPFEYFKNALKTACKAARDMRNNSYGTRKKPHVYVFSDEIEWCKEHAPEFGLNQLPYEVTYGISSRSFDENQCDMQLMASCDIMILELNSVYSYMAALLNPKPNKIVINPNKNRGIF